MPKGGLKSIKDYSQHQHEAKTVSLRDYNHRKKSLKKKVNQVKEIIKKSM